MFGRRVHIFGCRIHHGLVGAILTATGLFLIWHDRFDFPWTRDN